MSATCDTLAVIASGTIVVPVKYVEFSWLLTSSSVYTNGVFSINRFPALRAGLNVNVLNVSLIIR